MATAQSFLDLSMHRPSPARAQHGWSKTICFFFTKSAERPGMRPVRGERPAPSLVAFLTLLCLTLQRTHSSSHVSIPVHTPLAGNMHETHHATGAGLAFAPFSGRPSFRATLFLRGAELHRQQLALAPSLDFIQQGPVLLAPGVAAAKAGRPAGGLWPQRMPHCVGRSMANGGGSRGGGGASWEELFDGDGVEWDATSSSGAEIPSGGADGLDEETRLQPSGGDRGGVAQGPGAKGEQQGPDGADAGGSVPPESIALGRSRIVLPDGRFRIPAPPFCLSPRIAPRGAPPSTRF